MAEERYQHLYKTMGVNQSVCFYCSRKQETYEHVPPIEHAGAYPRDSKFYLVPVCEECNSLLTNCNENTVAKCALYLYKKYSEEYHKALITPDWSEHELLEMSAEFTQETKPLLEGKTFANDILNKLTEVVKKNSGLEVPDRPIPTHTSVSPADRTLVWQDAPEIFCDLDAVDWDNLEQEDYARPDFKSDSSCASDDTENKVLKDTGNADENSSPITVEIVKSIVTQVEILKLPITSFVTKNFKKYGLSCRVLTQLLNKLIEAKLLTYSSCFLEKNYPVSDNDLQLFIEEYYRNTLIKKTPVKKSTSLYRQHTQSIDHSQEVFHQALVTYILGVKEGKSTDSMRPHCMNERFDGHRCPGRINAYVTDSNIISYSCPVCRKKGVLNNWKQYAKNKKVQKKSFERKRKSYLNMDKNIKISTKKMNISKFPSILLFNLPDATLVNEVVTLAIQSQLSIKTFSKANYKKFAVSYNYLMALCNKLIDYDILDYSDRKLGKSKHEDVDELIFDFLHGFDKQLTNETELTSYDNILRKKYLEFKTLYHRIPTMKELDIDSTPKLRHVINSYDGYQRYIFTVEGISEEDLLLNYKQLVEKHEDLSPYTLLKNFGKFPAWLYVRCFGNLNNLVKAAKGLNDQNITIQHSKITNCTTDTKIPNLQQLANRPTLPKSTSAPKDPLVSYGRTSNKNIVQTIKEEQSDVIKTIGNLIKRIGIDLVDDKNGTPLILRLIEHEEFPLVKLLLILGVSPNSKERGGDRLITKAFDYEQFDIVQLLLELGADPNSKKSNGESLIIKAFNYNKYDFVINLLELGADPNTAEKDGNPLIIKAFDKNQHDLVQLLLELEANPNSKGKSGDPLIIKVIDHKQYDLVQFLIELGADPNSKESHGDSLIIKAFDHEKIDLVISLLELDADPNVTGTNGNPLIIKAFNCDEDDLVQLLLELGANPNSREKNGDQLIIKAFDNNEYDLVEYLLELGVDPNVTEKEGDPLITKVVDEDLYDLFQLLLELGADPNSKEEGGDPIIILAYKYKQLDMVRLVLEKYIEYIPQDVQKNLLELAEGDSEESLLSLLNSSKMTSNQNNQKIKFEERSDSHLERTRLLDKKFNPTQQKSSRAGTINEKPFIHNALDEILED